MESVGERLRKAREAKGSSIEQAARDTHISQNFLRAIEEEQFDLVPGETYLLGFIRKYSEYLQKDPQEMVTLYKNQLLQEQPLPIHELLNPKPRIWPKLLVAGVAAALLIAVGILAATGVLGIPFLDGEGNTHAAAADVQEQTLPAADEESAGAETPVSAALTDPDESDTDDIEASLASSADFARPVGSSSIASRRRQNQLLMEAAAPGPIQLRVEGGEIPSLVRLQADSVEPRQQMLSQGDSIQLEGTQYVQVYTSNAGAVSLTVNNTSIRLGSDGEVAVARFAWNNPGSDSPFRLEQVPVY
ncbi:RodZ domain-containing protein [Spirochaeta dissipatitropha]